MKLSVLLCQFYSAPARFSALFASSLERREKTSLPSNSPPGRYIFQGFLLKQVILRERGGEERRRMQQKKHIYANDCEWTSLKIH